MPLLRVGLTPPKIAETRLGLQGAGLTPEQRLLAMRYVIDRFAEKGKVDAPNGDIGGAFAGMMEETQRRLAQVTRTVGEGAFEIAYQPICDLGTGKASHYEALARFSNPEGTQETVAFIEALGIANTFDLAVASKVLAWWSNRLASISPSIFPARRSPHPPVSACWPRSWPRAASWRRAC
jgi:hypothetical protein